MADIAKFVEEIKGLTVMELADLVKAIEEEFGVSNCLSFNAKTEPREA